MINHVKRYFIERKIMRDIRKERTKSNQQRQKEGRAHEFKRGNP